MTNEEKIVRIIDANVNRAVEGLRVMEEVARFVIENKGLTEQLKKLRAKLRRLAVELQSKAQALHARQALSDVGGKLYTESESRRGNIKDVLVANAKRVQEALRVLEEFSKLTQPSAGADFKAIRFKVYELEKALAQRLMA